MQIRLSTYQRHLPKNNYLQRNTCFNQGKSVTETYFLFNLVYSACHKTIHMLTIVGKHIEITKLQKKKPWNMDTACFPILNIVGPWYVMFRSCIFSFFFYIWLTYLHFEKKVHNEPKKSQILMQRNFLFF